MLDKTCIYKFQELLSLMKASGKKNFFRTKSGISYLENLTDLFVNEYKEVFPGECNILKKYISKIINNRSFCCDDIMFLRYIAEIINKEFDKRVKPAKIFVSHSEKDIGIIEKFVDLLSHIGISTSQLFCSSLPGYNIKQGNGNIYDYLREELNNNVFVIFMLSYNYYKSIPCLNEMGAAWALKKKHQSILLPGFEYTQIRGAIDPYNISFKL